MKLGNIHKVKDIVKEINKYQELVKNLSDSPDFINFQKGDNEIDSIYLRDPEGILAQEGLNLCQKLIECYQAKIEKLTQELEKL